MKFNFVQNFVDKLLSEENHSVEDLNTILEYVDHLDASKKLIDQYSPEVKICDIKEQIISAFEKL